jgi:hypothetical protein
MWEARAADGRIDELVAWVLGSAAPEAQVYRSAAGEPRVVVIDPSGRGVGDAPAGLLARPAHRWDFEPVPRAAK